MIELTAIVPKLLSLFSWRKLYGYRRRLYSTDDQHMIGIKCINPKCTAPDGVFVFDETSIGASGISEKGKPGAFLYIIECPYCGTENMVWLNRTISSASYGMDVIIVKKDSQDFR